MIDIEDYKLIRDGIQAHIAYEYKDGQKVSYLWAFDMIFSFPYVSTLFIESQLKLRKYIQANKVSIENLKELRRRLDFYILDYSSFEEMIDVALEYSLCMILYDGVPRDLEDFRDIHNIKLSYSEEKKAKRITEKNADKYIKSNECIIPSSVEVVKIDAFKRKEILILTIPNSVRYIGDSAFAYNALQSLTIPNSVTHIGRSAFAHNQLKSVTILYSLKHIGDSAFAHNQLESVTIPYSLEHIGDSAFAHNQLKSVTIPNSVTHIGDSAFAHNHLESVTIPYSLKHIGDSAFAYNALQSLTIPNSVTHIGRSAFAHNQLKSVTIPDSVLIIGHFAFEGNQLTSVIIPEGISEIGIGVGAFKGNNLTNIVILGEETRFDKDWKRIGFPINLNPRLSESNGFIVEIHTRRILNYYQDDDNNKETELIIPNEINNIIVLNTGELTFQYMDVKSVMLPDSLEHIGREAFSGNKLTSINIPNSVKTIGDFAFGNNKLKSVMLPDSLEHIGREAFSGNKLTSINIPNSVKTIGDGAFEDNPLNEIIITKFRQKPMLLKALRGEKIKIKIKPKLFNLFGRGNHLKS
jgi:hypothetical protein